MRVRLSVGVWVVVALVAVAAGWGRPEPAVVVVVLLGSLLVHELAHAVAARASGYDVDLVRLSTFGGQVRWSGPDPEPHVALRIAAAGPFASALLACAFAFGGDGPVALIGAWTNLFATVVDLLPVPGLDGWKIYREVIRDRRAASRSANHGCSTDQT